MSPWLPIPGVVTEVKGNSIGVHHKGKDIRRVAHHVKLYQQSSTPNRLIITCHSSSESDEDDESTLNEVGSDANTESQSSDVTVPYGANTDDQDVGNDDLEDVGTISQTKNDDEFANQEDDEFRTREKPSNADELADEHNDKFRDTFYQYDADDEAHEEARRTRRRKMPVRFSDYELN